MIDLAKPICSGQFISIARKQVWIYFKYEILPFLSYGCGILDPTENSRHALDPWLRAETVRITCFDGLALTSPVPPSHIVELSSAAFALPSSPTRIIDPTSTTFVSSRVSPTHGVKLVSTTFSPLRFLRPKDRNNPKDKPLYEGCDNSGTLTPGIFSRLLV